MTTATTTRRRATGMLAAAAVAAAFALAFLGAGGVLLYGEAQKDDDGYLNTGRETFAASTHALTTDNLDVDLDGVEWLAERGKIRVEARPRTGRPLFLGIARTDDVSAYLAGTEHTVLTDVSTDPFRASYRDRPGDGVPAPPAGQGFWAASTHGAGTQELTWDLEDGDWSVVVMNADGSREVGATIRAGATIPSLGTAGWITTGGGILLLTAAGALGLVAARRSRAT